MSAVYRGKIFDQIAVMSFMYSDTEGWNSYVLSELKEILDDYKDVVKIESLGLSEKWQEELTV